MKDLMAQEALTETETVLVTDAGFAPAPVCDTLDLASDAAPEDLLGALTSNRIVRIDFPSFADGRGFTLARRLRQMGFTGHLRAKGHVLADQYAMARRSGFDDVEIDRALATRQPEDQWLDRANWRDHDHRSRLSAA
ncbi:DUF934 domain-containing protein [Nioella aestuarii]|uniref:DUF934 domain-containing protein n=1 Tax=Nioella aestuarii TaxID=1662864 RepID=UPI003D7F82B8